MAQNRSAGRGSHTAHRPLSSAQESDGDTTNDAHGQQLPIMVATIPIEPFSAASVPMPTRKGVTIGLAKLPDLASALAQAETTARAMGLLS